jgi:hypothetical protein
MAQRRRRYLACRASSVVVVVVQLLSPPSTTTVPFAASQSVACVDTPDWKDLYGDTCVYYSSKPDRCQVWGWRGAGKMGVANDNCCVCGGGVEDVDLVGVIADGVVVNPDGTCGKGGGDRGNGRCPNGKCCSTVRSTFSSFLVALFSVHQETDETLLSPTFRK